MFRMLLETQHVMTIPGKSFVICNSQIDNIIKELFLLFVV